MAWENTTFELNEEKNAKIASEAMLVLDSDAYTTVVVDDYVLDELGRSNVGSEEYKKAERKMGDGPGFVDPEWLG